MFNQRRLLQAVRGRDEPASGAPDRRKAAAAKREMTERFYFAQCLKTRRWRVNRPGACGRRGRRPAAAVVHFNGSFHSEPGSARPSGPSAGCLASGSSCSRCCR